MKLLLLAVFALVSVAHCEDGARLLASKSLLNRYAVEGKDLTLQYNIYNVGSSAALDVELSDDSFPPEDFGIVSGMLNVKWDRIAPASNVSHTVVLRPLKAGYFNFTSATITYLAQEGAQVVVGFTSAPGQGGILAQRDFDRRFSPHFVMGSSSPIVILQDVPKQPESQPSIRYKPKTTRIITRDLIRDLIIPQEKPQPCLIIGEKEYEKLKESARAPTEVEHWDRLKTLRAKQDAAFLFLNAKCNMIRDKQVLEKRMINKELEEEEKRLDKMMEMEREKGMEVQEELERQRKQELMRARQDIVKQMEQNAEERALRAEELYQEGQRQLERLEQMKREDRKAWEQKQERLKQIHADIKRFNMESQRLKDQQREQERLEDERVLEQQRQKAEWEATLQAEQQQLRLEKEKELARLRATQERAQDWQAERDALRAKRNQEVADREWRRRELEKARKKAELEQQLKQDRLEQVAQKEQYLAMQVQQDRQEFQRVLRAHQEQLQREKLEQEQRELRQRAHAEDLRRQIQELQQQRQRQRAAFIEEGRQQQQEVQQRSQRLAQFRQQKLQEFRVTGMPEKYCAQVERKAQSQARRAPS